MLNVNHVQERLVATGDFRTGKNGEVEAAFDAIELDHAHSCQLRITFKLRGNVVSQSTFPSLLRDDTAVLSFPRHAYIPVSLSSD